MISRERIVAFKCAEKGPQPQDHLLRLPAEAHTCLVSEGTLAVTGLREESGAWQLSLAMWATL